MNFCPDRSRKNSNVQGRISILSTVKQCALLKMFTLCFLWTSWHRADRFVLTDNVCLSCQFSSLDMNFCHFVSRYQLRIILELYTAMDWIQEALTSVEVSPILKDIFKGVASREAVICEQVRSFSDFSIFYNALHLKYRLISTWFTESHVWNTIYNTFQLLFFEGRQNDGVR